jgi:uncharacterized membrane protein
MNAPPTASLTASSTAEPFTATARRWRLDALRGLAVVAMVVFHLAWDLSALGFIATDVAQHPGWRLFAQAIAASFLIIAGAALSLAHADGFRPGPFLRRIAVVAGAALLVTLGTWLAFPDRFVVFGILHAIAVFSLLAVPLLRQRWWFALTMALGVTLAHHWVQSSSDAGLQSWLAASALHPLWQHLGLTWEPPLTVDFIPLFPWFGWLLVGLSAGSWLRQRPAIVDQPPSIQPLSLLGRWSLPIYLLHQPVLYGGLMLLAMGAPQLTVGHAQRLDLRFASDCVTQCRATASREQCDRGCACVLKGLQARPDLHRRVVIEGREDAQTNDAFRTVVDQCRRSP